MSAESSLTVNHGSVTRVETTGVTSDPQGAGDLKLTMTVADGDIGTIVSTGRITGYGGTPIQAPNGKIGTISAAKPISQFQGDSATSPMIRAKNGIDSIEAPSIDGYITANYGSGATGELHRVVTTHATDGVGVNSRVVAKKVTKRANENDRIEIKGSLLGEIVMDELSTGATIAVGGRILHDSGSNPTNVGKITISNSGGLKGQIILNAANATDHLVSGSGAGDWAYYWAGDITIGGTPINNTSTGTNPYYATPSSFYGGGSVTVAPFYEHRADCTGWPTDFGDDTDPIRIAQTAISGTSGVTLERIHVGFYGRLVAGTDLGAVEMWNGTQWQNVNSLFEMNVDSSSPRDLQVCGRQIGYPARRIPVPPGKYRIIQGTGDRTLRSLDTDPISGAQPATALFWEYFCVIRDCDHDGQPDSGVSCGDTNVCATPYGGCLADCNDGTGTGHPDGGVDINDLLYFLAAYQAGSMNADLTDGVSTPCGARADGGVDINDLLCFLDHYEAGC